MYTCVYIYIYYVLVSIVIIVILVIIVIIVIIVIVIIIVILVCSRWRPWNPKRKSPKYENDRTSELARCFRLDCIILQYINYLISFIVSSIL